MMESINRLNSPMALYVEDLKEHPLELEKRRKTAQNAVQESSASFLVGSIESVSQKIAHLEEQLKTFCSDDLETESPEIYRKIFLDGQSPSYFDPMKEKTQCEKKSKEYDTRDLQQFTHRYQMSMTKKDFVKYPKAQEITKKDIKPKLAELCQFPGFSYHGPVPLPHEISVNTIIEKVVSAHKKTGAKICSTRQLHRILSAPVTQTILLDCYWWIFLQRYKPDAESQSKLFDRVAENYIQLLTLCQGSYHGDAFLNFQSDDFKAELCGLLWQWFGGICPVSGVYNSWDYVTLEPKDDTSNGKVQQKIDLDTFWFGTEEKNTFSTSSGFRARKYSVFKPSRKNSSASSHSSLHKKEAALPPSIEHLQGLKGSEARDVGKLKTGMKSSKVTPAKESRPACQKANFIHMAFNLSGHSPLVQYYLEKRQADPQAGVSVLVQRTEIQKQIPTSTVTSYKGVTQGHQPQRIK
ncbi:protein FAM227A isoform X2 [Dendropsophus ebraccatus]|uniref:protein FAM227A isoform X2 n=1 Tax=Dendropsophus ebraccatus TaxID=150705 RepID=UPI0038321A4E